MSSESNVYFYFIVSGYLFSRDSSLQSSQDGLGTRLVNAAALLLSSVDDLAVVNDNGVTASALAHGPADALAELGLGVGSKDLRVHVVRLMNLELGYGELVYVQ